VARPKNQRQDLWIYLFVCKMRRKFYRPDKPGKQPIPFSWCYEHTRKWLERKGVHLGQEGEYGAIRAACARGKINALKLAKVFRLPEHLTEEFLAWIIEQRLVMELQLGESHQQMARQEEDTARNRAFESWLSESVELVSRLEKPRRKKLLETPRC
jgi:hypothetical protein